MYDNCNFPFKSIKYRFYYQYKTNEKGKMKTWIMYWYFITLKFFDKATGLNLKKDGTMTEKDVFAEPGCEHWG